MLRKNVAGQFLYFAGVNATTGAALTGATFSVRRAIDGTFAAGGGTITEDTGLGFYKCALSQADTNGNDLAFFFTATNAVPVCINVLTTAADPSDSVRLGLTALPNAAAEAAGGLYTRGTGAGQIAQDANGNVRVNLDTIKTQTVTCAAGVTVLASVGTAATSTAQTGDNYARLGAPVGASISADIANVYARTDVATSTRLASAGYTAPLDAAGTRAAVGLASANPDTQLDALPTAAENATAVLTTAMTESYAADGATRTLAQATYELIAHHGESSISGVTKTIHKIDGTTAAATFTLDDATTPTAITRST